MSAAQLSRFPQSQRDGTVTPLTEPEKLQFIEIAQAFGHNPFPISSLGLGVAKKSVSVRISWQSPDYNRHKTSF